MEYDIVIPTTYEQWRHCITQKCRIQLTRIYVLDRMKTLADASSEENRNFRRLYGDTHYESVKQWFRQALAELDRGAN